MYAELCYKISVDGVDLKLIAVVSQKSEKEILEELPLKPS